MKKYLILILSLLILLTAVSCEPAHSHEFGSEWTTDATQHWKACSGKDCEEITAKAAHTYGEPTVTEPTTEAEGKRVYKCTVCGAEKTETIEKLPAHTCDFSKEWTSNDNYHWHICTGEDCTKVSDKAEHSFGESEITKYPTSDTEGERQSICSVCDKTKIEAIEKLPSKMSETEWILLFTYENVRIDSSADMDAFGSVETVMLVDGDIVLCDPDTDGQYYADRTVFSDIVFSNDYDSFNHIGNNVYTAASVMIEEEGMEVAELSDVILTITDGVISSISYNMNTFGISVQVTYTFSMWGEVIVEYEEPTLNEGEFAELIDPENFENVTLDVFRYDDEYTDVEYITYYYDGNNYLCEIVGEDDYITEEGSTDDGTVAALVNNADLFEMLNSLSAENFTYSLVDEMFAYGGTASFGGEEISDLFIGIENGVLSAVYFITAEGINVNYDFFDYGITVIESEVAE